MQLWIQELPGHLSERTRVANDGIVPQLQGEFVLYWMCTALRTDENPALDVARWFATKLDKPLLIYHSLAEDYEFASDRHHTFILEAARDLQSQAAGAGLSYAFHLQIGNDRRPHLITLADQSALVVAEDMPVDPPRRFLSGLLKKSLTPVLLVDTACVVPMQLVGRAYTRAYQYRECTDHLYRQRITRAWPEWKEPVEQFDFFRLPFCPVQFKDQSIAELVAACQIDHAVGPVRDTRGGSEAGYQRWENFRKKGLRSYAKLRNDALTDGVSRMSAYLHYGMVSPFRLAREAAAANHAGAEKFLDELLIWRELAYAFCRFRSDHDSVTAIPDWARQTLAEHQTDPRPAIYSWETLARGEAEDRLWNAAQHSLLIHGELHNNLRMTWGKSILQWTRTPEEALRLLIDLNHRYALDGRDPASYGGILWCLGQFDRPFLPPQPIYGTIRLRTTGEHGKRLDPQTYVQHIRRPRTGSSRRVAVIGAGISGAMAARTLADHGVDVTVFEKSRGAGGRMATRRTEFGSQFDHGAQYFTVRDNRFQRYVRSWLEQGLVGRWPDPVRDPSQRIAVIRQGCIADWSDDQERFVGQPSMNSICQHLLRGVHVLNNTKIDGIKRAGEGLSLVCDHGTDMGRFDRVIVSAPAPQTAALLAGISPLAERIAGIAMQPCWAVMADFASPIAPEWVGAFLHDSFITWVARNGTKPGRQSTTPSTELEQVVIHLEHHWTSENWERSADWVADAALAELQKAIGIRLQKPIQVCAHRWRYALVPSLEPLDGCFDRHSGIAVCGDWTNGSRVEGAFLSGMAAAGRILGSFDENQPVVDRQQLLLFE